MDNWRKARLYTTHGQHAQQQQQKVHNTHSLKKHKKNHKMCFMTATKQHDDGTKKHALVQDAGQRCTRREPWLHLVVETHSGKYTSSLKRRF